MATYNLISMCLDRETQSIFYADRTDGTIFHIENYASPHLDIDEDEPATPTPTDTETDETRYRDRSQSRRGVVVLPSERRGGRRGGRWTSSSSSSSSKRKIKRRNAVVLESIPEAETETDTPCDPSGFKTPPPAASDAGDEGSTTPGSTMSTTTTTTSPSSNASSPSTTATSIVGSPLSTASTHHQDREEATSSLIKHWARAHLILNGEPSHSLTRFMRDSDTLSSPPLASSIAPILKHMVDVHVHLANHAFSPCYNATDDDNNSHDASEIAIDSLYRSLGVLLSLLQQRKHALQEVEEMKQKQGR